MQWLMPRGHVFYIWVRRLFLLALFGTLSLIHQPSAWIDTIDGEMPGRVDVVSNEFVARGPVDTEFVELVFQTICQSGIRNPTIVMRQAILETGWFRSPFLMTRNNLFAFRRGNYLRFNHFEHSILFYKAWQDRNMPSKIRAYYLFLDQIQYGSPDYTGHLLNISWNRSC